VPVSLNEEAKNLVRSTLFGKDFDTYVTEIIATMKLIFGEEITANWTAPSSPGRTLIEATAFALSTAAWYGDRQADDTNLRDVRIRTAAVTIARQLGYKPSAAVPPAVSITMTLDNAPTVTRLTLEAGRVLVGPNGLTYLMSEEVIFDVGEVGPKTFTAIEGTSVEEIFTGTGLPNQFYLLETIPAGQSIAQDTPRAYVNSFEWVENALLAYEQTNQFEIGYGFNPPRLQFGDGIAGNIPSEDAEIRVSYITTSGPAGVVQANTVVAFQSPLVAGPETLTAVLVHDEPSTPGGPRESIDSIKVNAPQVFQTAGRAVTQADYDALINAFVDPIYGAVAIGRATVPRSVDQDAEALTIIAEIEEGCPLALALTTILDGPFVVGEVVTGATSGATALVIGVVGSSLSVIRQSGDLVVGESISGVTSLATGTIATISLSSTAERLRSYWDKVLASNCQANVVIAQVLAADAVGRYVAAPQGLAEALETYLDALAESTVKVRVTDGSVNLLAVDLTVSIQLDPAITTEAGQQTVVTDVRAALETELLGRAYGDSLRISDLYTIADAISGVVYSNIAVTAINGATPTRLNSFGDLVIESFEVLTLGAQVAVSIVA